MVQVIFNLGTSESSFDAATVIRLYFVSLGFVICVVFAARYTLSPTTTRLNPGRSQDSKATRIACRHTNTVLLWCIQAYW